MQAGSGPGHSFALGAKFWVMLCRNGLRILMVRPGANGGIACGIAVCERVTAPARTLLGRSQVIP